MKNFIDIFSVLIIKQERKKLYLLLFGMLITAFFDILGVASIAPFMAVVIDPSIIHSNQYLTLLYSSFGSKSDQEFIVLLGIVVIVTLIIANTISGLMVWATIRFGQLQGHNLSCRLLSRYLFEPYEFHLNRNSSDLGKNILSEVSRMVDGVIMNVLSIIAKTVVSAFMIIMLVIVDPIMALSIIVVVGGSYLIIYKLLRNRLDFLGTKTTQFVFKKFKAVNEAIGGVKEIKLRSAEKLFIQNFFKPSKRNALYAAQATALAYFPRYVLETVAFGGLVSIVIILMSMGQSSSQVIPVLALYALAGYRLLPALQTIYQGFTTLRFNLPVLDIIYADLLGEKNIITQDFTPPPLDISSTAKLINISYNYPNSEKKVLDKVNLLIEKNTTIALVGSTGAGKTTLVDLILGLVSPQKGKMSIDGLDINKENLRSWQKNISYVPQSIYLTDNTISNNIAFSVSPEKINLEQVYKAAEMAQLDDFISTLPNKYNTIVGENGVRLSGGQRQRIGIARALYTNPKLLVLDEATSALDGITENIIIETVDNLAHKMTIIIVTHRLTTIKGCDIIYLMKNGKIVNSGSYKELLDSDEQFKKMANL